MLLIQSNKVLDKVTQIENLGMLHGNTISYHNRLTGYLFFALQQLAVSYKR